MSDAYIAGADMIAFGRYPDRTYYELGAEATLLAIDHPPTGERARIKHLAIVSGEARDAGRQWWLRPSDTIAEIWRP